MLRRYPTVTNGRSRSSSAGTEVRCISKVTRRQADVAGPPLIDRGKTADYERERSICTGSRKFLFFFFTIFLFFFFFFFFFFFCFFFFFSCAERRAELFDERQVTWRNKGTTLA